MNMEKDKLELEKIPAILLFTLGTYPQDVYCNSCQDEIINCSAMYRMDCKCGGVYNMVKKISQ